MKKVSKLFSKRGGIISAIVGFGLSVPTVVSAGLNDLMYAVAETLFRFFLWPAITLLRLELWALPKIASYNDFTREKGVIDGWTVVRDITNTFFIVILLVIAFATILRISSYGYKQLLSRLLIVAILVNFSMSIVGFAIDISQVIMLTFLNSIKELVAGNIMVGLGLDEVFNLSSNLTEQSAVEAAGDIGDYIASLVMAGVMLVITVVILAAFIGMLAMRIVKLWISLVLAPAAFVAFVFPNAKKYYNEWSMDLGKNLMTGPALLFFLWLAFTILAGDRNLADSMDITSQDQLNEFSEVLDSKNIVKYIMGTALLLGGLQFAAKSGAAGSSLMGKASSKINSTASALGKRYVGGMASRAGDLGARAFVDGKGNARGLGKVASAVVPFWGGRLQRSAMKMRGYNAARIAREREEDQKYIPDEMKVAFQKSQATAYLQKGSWQRKLGDGAVNLATTGLGKVAGGDKTGVGRALKGFEVGEGRLGGAIDKVVSGVGKGMSFATSFGGGISDAQVKLAQNRVATGEDLGEYEDETYRALRSVNDQDSIDRMQADGYVKNITARDAANLVDKFGVSMLNRMREQSAVEEVVGKDGKTRKKASDGAKNILDAMGDRADIDGVAMALEAERGGKKFLRIPLAEYAVDKVNQGIEDGTYRSDQIYSENEDGMLTVDQTGHLNTQADKEMIKFATFANAIYPNMAKPTNIKITSMGNQALLDNRLVLDSQVLTAIEDDGEREKAQEKDEDNVRRATKLVKHKAKKEGRQISDEDAILEAQKMNIVQSHRRQSLGYYTNREASRQLDQLDTERDAVIRDKSLAKDERDKKLDRIDDEKEKVYQSAGIVMGKDDAFDNRFVEFAAQRKVDRSKYTDAEYDIRVKREVAKLRKALGDIPSELTQALDDFEDKKRKHIADGGKKEDPEYKKLQRDQRSMLRESTFQQREIIDQRANYKTDLTQGALVRTAQDGMNYERLFEMDISDPVQRDIFVNLSLQANQAQQGQILKAGTPQQVKLFAETLARAGIKVSKVIMDNLEPMVAAHVYELQYIAKKMKEGWTYAQAQADTLGKDLAFYKKELR